MSFLILGNSREQPQSLIAWVGVWDVPKIGVSTVGKCVDFIFRTQGMTLVNKLSNKITLNVTVNVFF